MEKTGEYEKETPLAAEFRECMERSVKNCLKCVSYSNVCRAFPEVDKSALKSLHQGMTADLTAALADYTSEFLQEKGVVQKLNELWCLSKDLPITNQKAWRPSGDPVVDIEPHLTELKQKQLRDLKTELSRVQMESESKLRRCELLEDDIDQNHNVVKAAIQKLKNSKTTSDS